ncbi:hypothetical protein BIW11_13180 [Tropilaelaps mercedesae]|uniref:Uncharacterized protein n=1 Tax=Tropilaelaps mercedesae TaxID=418985 RepID=A0A1V9X3E4_9ACAR|nr:hypothetical protein BIW11_13180 [Tropilaelaps mercedesae]
MSSADSVKKPCSQFISRGDTWFQAVYSWLTTLSGYYHSELIEQLNPLRKCSKSGRLLVYSALLSMLAVVFVRTAGNVSRFVHDERCLVRVPSFLQNAFVPPYNCTLCEGLEQVPSILANETGKYRHWISRKEVPLVIRGAYERVASSAPLTWSALRDMYFQGSSHVPSEDDSELGMAASVGQSPATAFTTCQFFAYNTEFTSLREALTMSDERMSQHFYIGW